MLSGKRPHGLPAKIVLSIAAVALVGGLLAWPKLKSALTYSQGAVEILDPAQVVVLRTPGGMLEVATLMRIEEFGWQATYTCPLVDCKLFKPTVTRIRVPVHYTFRIPLADTWTLRLEKGEYVLAVPAPQPKLPPAMESAKAEFSVEKQAWFSPPAAPVQSSMMKQFGPELDRRAARVAYHELARPQAEKTVREFAEKWMRDQVNGPQRPVRVIFKEANGA